MKMEANLQHRLEQRLKLSQHIIQSLQLLQVPLLDLQQLVEDELLQNPTLETAQESPDDDREAAAERTDAPAENESETSDQSVASDQMEVLERIEEEFHESNKPNKGSAEQTERKYEMLQNVEAAGSSLRDYLADQVILLELPVEIRPTVLRLIDYINDDGYLFFPEIEAVAKMFAAAEPNPADQEGMAKTLSEQFPNLSADNARRHIAAAAAAAETVRRQWQDPLIRADELARLLIEDELVEQFARQHPETAREQLLPKIRSAIAIVQHLEPLGVGARTLQECLLLQLAPEDERAKEKETLIRLHLDNIANNRLPRIAKEMVIEMEAVKSLIDEIARLNPKPGATIGQGRNVPIIPDVIVTESDDQYEVTLEDGYVPAITINRTYQTMLKDKNLSKEEREFIQRKLESGKRLINAIEHRKSTIYRIARFIIDHQREFMEKGIEHLKPLKMSEISSAVGVHLSTVSRAIAGKYIQTPKGIFAMKFFLAGAAPKSDVPFPMTLPRMAASPQNGDETESDEPTNGDSRTRQALLALIDKLVNAEDPKRPLSDLELTVRLQKDGYNVARRTVAKYREELGIRSSRLRTKY